MATNVFLHGRMIVAIEALSELWEGDEWQKYGETRRLTSSRVL